MSTTGRGTRRARFFGVPTRPGPGWRVSRGRLRAPPDPAAAADRGFVTVEAAVCVLTLVPLLGLLLWAVTVSVDRVKCVDAAREGARAAARDEEPRTVREVVRSVAPGGARMKLWQDGGVTRVRVEARSFGLGGLSVTVRAESAALTETRGDPPAGGADPRGSPPPAAGDAR